MSDRRLYAQRAIGRLGVLLVHRVVSLAVFFRHLFMNFYMTVDKGPRGGVPVTMT